MKKKYLLGFVFIGIVMYLYITIYLPRYYFIKDFNKNISNSNTNLSFFNFIYIFEPSSIDPFVETVIEINKKDYNYLLNNYICLNEMNITNNSIKFTSDNGSQIKLSKEFLRRFDIRMIKETFCLKSKSKYYNYIIFKYNKRYFLYISYIYS